MPSETPIPAPGADAAAAVSVLNRAARKVRTPCGDGTMVWRVWGAGDPLVLLHGGSGSWTHWIRTIPGLSRHYELWVPDIPGLGSSAMPPKPWVPASIAEVAAAGVDELFPPSARLRIAGFSFGGHVATLLAARLGRRVADLTLIGVAALGLKAEPRERFHKERPGMSARACRGLPPQPQVLMFADPADRRPGDPPAGREYPPRR
jgi:pimeloyl-ACP methyl ester carboxylesterase